jgi:hypothetical protein
MAAQDNAPLAQTFYDSYNNRDFDQAITLCDEDLQWVNFPSGETFRGRRAAGSSWKAGPTASPSPAYRSKLTFRRELCSLRRYVPRNAHRPPCWSRWRNSGHGAVGRAPLLSGARDQGRQVR